MPRTGLVLAAALLIFSTGRLSADETARTVEQITEFARKSVAVITHTGRDGQRQGLGSGFVVSADGLIATNLHVIGDGRPVAVQLADGKRYDVTAVHASDRSLDLAILRVNAKGLTPLPLGDSAALKQGQSVVVLGNPQGLQYSVVSGVVSGTRQIDGRLMIQLAIPVEPGNSGGPVLDMQGRVQGVVTMKSRVTPNLGFAMPVNAFKPLLQKPNPVPLSRWLTIGALDPKEWQPHFGANWRRHAGHILVEGQGSGFGGRSLCLWQETPPPVPFEMAVTVKLDDESGAAGLVFHADGQDKHYGFYPSGGQLRLTRFEGPDVYSWKILHQGPSADYHPGDWNRIKVRVEKDKVRCFVNDRQVFESDDNGLTTGRVGLAKFRDTRAEFKQFQVGKELKSAAVTAEARARVRKAVTSLPKTGIPPKAVDSLLPDGAAGMAVLRDQAKTLEEQAARLRQLAQAVHQKQVQSELAKLFQTKEEEIDLLRGALLLARLDNEELDVPFYLKEVDRMVREVTDSLPKSADEPTKLAALNKYLFEERGFHGSRGDYYNRANSYLSEVIDDREGIPITLSVLYLELSRRLGLHIVGIGLPGHFVVQHRPTKGEPQLLDVFEGAKPMSRDDAAALLKGFGGRELEERDLTPVTKRAILVRMLHNLLGIARSQRDTAACFSYLDTILTLSPDEAASRMERAVLRAQSGRKEEAKQDADWVLEHHPPEINLERVQEFRKMLDRLEP